MYKPEKVTDETVKSIACKKLPDPLSSANQFLGFFTSSGILLKQVESGADEPDCYLFCVQDLFRRGA